MKASSDSPFEQPIAPSQPAAEEHSPSTTPTEGGSQPRREYGGPRRDQDRDRRGGERGERSDRGDRGGRDRGDRDRRGPGRRDDRGRPDRRPGGRSPYQGSSPEPTPDSQEEIFAAPSPEPIIPASLPAIPPSPSRSFEDNVFGRTEPSSDLDSSDLSDLRHEDSDTEDAHEGGQNAESTEVRYGRSRHRRYPLVNSDADEKPENAEPASPTPDEPASTEPIEFGRFRRKRFGDK